MVRMITTTGGLATVAVLGTAGSAFAGGAAVTQNSSASMALRVYHDASMSEFLNGGGDVSVRRGQTVSLGSNIFTNAAMFGTWNEVVGGSTTRVQVSFWTEDDSPLVPEDALISGEPVSFIGWEFGTTNPVDFGSWVSEVTIISATAFATNGSGFYDEFNITSTVENPWDGMGGHATQSVGTWVEASQIGLEFEYLVAPSPAAAGVLIVAGAAGLGRRRRD